MLATKLGHFCGEVCAISFFAPPSFPCRQPFSMSCFGTHCCAVGAEGHCSSEMKALAFRSLPDASTLERLADPRHHHLPPFFFCPLFLFSFPCCAPDASDYIALLFVCLFSPYTSFRNFVAHVRACQCSVMRQRDRAISLVLPV